MKYVKKERLYNLEYKEAEITDKIKNSKKPGDIQKCLHAGVLPKCYEGTAISVGLQGLSQLSCFIHKSDDCTGAEVSKNSLPGLLKFQTDFSCLFSMLPRRKADWLYIRLHLIRVFKEIFYGLIILAYHQAIAGDYLFCFGILFFLGAENVEINLPCNVEATIFAIEFLVFKEVELALKQAAVRPV